MATSTVTTTAPKSGNVDVKALFAQLGPQYKRNRKLADAIIGIMNTPKGNVDQSMTEVRALIDNLNLLVAHGDGYTPPTNMGFGSDNASTISLAVLGQRASTSSIRTKFAAVVA